MMGKLVMMCYTKNTSEMTKMKKNIMGYNIMLYDSVH